MPIESDDPLMRAFLAAPDDDEPVTAEDLAAIAEARDSFARGDAEAWPLRHA